MLLLPQTSKFDNTSTATHKLAPRASNMIKWLNAVSANDPWALYKVNPAAQRWQRHHSNRVRCSGDIERINSFLVGIGRLAGRARGARAGGSRNIWCEIDECLYLCPRRWFYCWHED